MEQAKLVWHLERASLQLEKKRLEHEKGALEQAEQEWRLERSSLQQKNVHAEAKILKLDGNVEALLAWINDAELLH